MDILFGHDCDDSQTTTLNVTLQRPAAVDKSILLLDGEQEPLPLLPTDIQNGNSNEQIKPSSTVSSSNVIRNHSNRAPVDIREVPSEMPMCLLAEDEGNEEEILRLMESTSPQHVTGPPKTMHTSSCSTAVSSDCCISTSMHRSSSVPPDFHFPRKPTSSKTSFDNIREVGEDCGLKKGGKLKRPQPAKKPHGGGWPKGKKRRSHQLPPKLPATGYGLYISENRLSVKQQCATTSMPILSRKLGKMWSELTAEQKKVYYSRAKTDRVRYLEELEKYLMNSYEGMDLLRATEFINKCFSGDSDDNCLSCHICQLNFTSLYNKQSHYAGKLHLQTLLQHLEQILKHSERDAQQSSDYNNSSHDTCVQPSLVPSIRVVEPFGVSTSLNRMAANFDSFVEKESFLRAKIRQNMEMKAVLQQEYVEAEVFYFNIYKLLHEAVLNSITDLIM